MRNDYQKYEIWNSLCASMVLSASAFSAGLKVVRLEGETSNSLFDTLEDWNAYLKAEKIEFPQRENPSRQPSRRGPSL